MNTETWTPVIGDGRIIGYIVRIASGSYFVQRKTVPRGHCVNYGPRYH